MADAQKGDLIQIHNIILEPEDRPDTLPESTKAVPFEVWIKGFLLDSKADIGDRVRMKTFIGRELTGTLTAVNPMYDHNFGLPRKELLPIGGELKKRQMRK